jgi:hypothetical protein
MCMTGKSSPNRWTLAKTAGKEDAFMYVSHFPTLGDVTFLVFSISLAIADELSKTMKCKLEWSMDWAPNSCTNL